MFVEIIEKLPELTVKQQEAVGRLVKVCRKRDGIRLSYPLEPGMADAHYLLWGHAGDGSRKEDMGSGDRQLLSVLAFSVYSRELAECTAFTHPRCRNQGCFMRLLDRALEDYEEYDILFPVSGQCKDTQAALDALGAEPESREYQMEKDLAGRGGAEGGNTADGGNTTDDGNAADGAGTVKGSEAGRLRWTADFRSGPVSVSFFLSPEEELPVGTLQTYPASAGSVCLHHVEIASEYRGRGIGTKMIRLLCEKLEEAGIAKVLLQVSAENAPALAMYQKTGFRITETLLYYLY